MADGRCQGITGRGEPCARPAGAGGFCDRHDPARAAERGRRGGLAKASKGRAERAAQAQALALETVADLRATLTAAVRAAFEDGDWSVVVSAVRAGAELLKAHDQQAEIEALKALVAERVPGAAARLGRALQ